MKVGKNKAQNVLLVENLKPSLLSVSQTCDQGHICIFDSQKCEVVKKKTGKVVATALRTAENVYILNTEPDEECQLNLVDESWLWHRRLGHINFDSLVRASGLGAIRNLPKIIKPQNFVCKHCQFGK